ncbi:hypothetical protein [Micromonospora humidisoli]|uniref:Uncharacterized protein n=1 Tax=Micromonospora humidisoli TaxID=2807622 RepID=A0ABS2JD19_9ACTN|nr:hypothetical protein [Micromonospora humidisoli]MBM7083628.1 hypothetical protein [Micromonospora humidisoli]
MATIVPVVDFLVARPGLTAVVVLAVACAVVLAWITVLLGADRHDRVVRVVGVAPRPAPPPARPTRPGPPVNAMLAAYVARRAAESTAALNARAGRP